MAGFLGNAPVLRLAADARDRFRNVDRRQKAARKQPCIKIDLPVGNRDQVSGNVGGDLSFSVSTIGSAVMLPPPWLAAKRVERSSRRE